MLRIFYTNLGLYNEGVLSGEWLDLPATDEEIESLVKRTGYDELHEEYFIADYESDIDISIGEFESLDYLNELAEIIDDEPEKVEALLWHGYKTIEDIIDNLDNVQYVTTPKNFQSEDEAVGLYFGLELGCVNIPDELINYFDFESYGRDIIINGTFYTAKNGDIYEIVD